MNIFRNKKSSRKGFTLVEVLIAVAIVAILTAIAIPSISAISRSLHQKQLDDYAQSVYLAAQDHLVSLRKSGTISKFANEKTYPTVPAENNAGFPYTDSLEEITGKDGKAEMVEQYAFITSASDDLADVLPAGSIDDTVRSGYAYLIEYNRYTGDVYAVFLTDSDDLDLSKGYEDLDALNADKDLRENSKLRRKNFLGYYQGELVHAPDAIEKAKSLGVYLELEDSQEFLVRLYVPLPEKMRTNNPADPESFAKSISSVSLSVTGTNSGHTRSYDILTGNTPEYVRDETTGLYTELCYEVTLQSLDTNRDYKLDEGDGALYYGENASFSAKVNSNRADLESSNIAEGNPWFSYYDSAFASIYVSNGRHLQNLSSLRGTEYPVEKVCFSNDIDWQETMDYYAGSGRVLSFKPLESVIYQKSDFTLDGADYTLSNLYIDDYDNKEENAINTGLFRQFAGTASDLIIKNPTVRGSQSESSNVGAFAGIVSGKLDKIGIELTWSGNFSGLAGENPQWCGACGKGNTGLIAGQNSGTMSNITVRSSIKKGSFGTPVCGNSYGMVVGSNKKDADLSISFLKGYLSAGEAVSLGVAVGTNSGTVNVSGTYECTVEGISCSTFGGVVGTNSGTLLADEDSDVGVAISSTFTPKQDFYYGGVVGQMVGGSVDGFTVSSAVGASGEINVTGDRESSAQVYLGGIVGKIISGSLGDNAIDHAKITVNSFKAYFGALAGYSATALSGSELTLTEANLSVTTRGQVYAGGLAGVCESSLSKVQLNSAGTKGNFLSVTNTGTDATFVGGLAGVLTGVTSSNILAAERTPLNIKVQSDYGTVYLGGFVGNGPDNGNGMSISDSYIRIDDSVKPEEDGSTDATVLSLSVRAKTAYVGGFSSYLRGSGASLASCEASGLEILVEKATTVYAGGAVAYLESAALRDLNLSGKLELDDSSVSAGAKFAGGVVGTEAGSEAEKKYENVSAAVSLSGWGRYSAGSLYEDPSRQGVNVGQFIGYVFNGQFKDCSSTVDSGSYQFLGKIAFGGDDSSVGTYYTLATKPSEDDIRAWMTPIRTESLNTMNKVAESYGLQLAGVYSSHKYEATLENCTFKKGGDIYNQIIKDGTVYCFSGHQTAGYYTFNPVILTADGLTIGATTKDHTSVVVYDVKNGTILYSPGQTDSADYLIADRALQMTVAGKKLSDPKAFQQGILYYEDANLSNYVWEMGRSYKAGSVGFFDGEAYRIYLQSRRGPYMVPYYNFADSVENPQVIFFNESYVSELFNQDLPQQMYMKDTGNGTYQLMRRGQTALGELLRIDTAPRLTYRNGTYSVRFDDSSNYSEFSFYEYSAVTFADGSDGFYFKYLEDVSDSCVSYQKSEE